MAGRTPAVAPATGLVADHTGHRFQRVLPGDGPIFQAEAFNVDRRVVVAIKFRAQDAPQLREEIANATKIDESDRVTSKSSRNYPAKKKLRRSGPPIIAKPTKEQKKRPKIHLE